jgi:hypothetical protein
MRERRRDRAELPLGLFSPPVLAPGDVHLGGTLAAASAARRTAWTRPLGIVSAVVSKEVEHSQPSRLSDGEVVRAVQPPPETVSMPVTMKAAGAEETRP